MKLEFPFLWLTQQAKASPKPWKYFDIEGVMLNAYDILKKPMISERIKKQKVHNYLKFDGVVAIDSGGFLFMKHNEVPISPEKLVEVYEEWKPNFAVSLDHPIFPSLPENIIRKRQRNSLENLKTMVEIKRGDNPVLIPVIHGYNKESLEWYIRELEKIGEFDIYGIGSLVPLAKGIKGGKGGLYKAIDVIMFIKKLIPDRKLHVFGVGSSLTMHIMFLSGADSIDSSSWRSKAAFGAIQLPGIGDRYITGKTSEKYPDLSPNEVDIVKRCQCPACREHGLEGLRTKFTLRAIHNAWVYQKEIYKIRAHIKEGTYEEYVRSIIKGHKVYKKIFEYILKQRSQLEIIHYLNY
ncbi:tRNA-guanine transglycosylase [Thermococcus sp.]|uniref:tRNA-guanine transglycosylase n=1 Tax=Thermococcus sp. TaxID=35749 RepID=UPI0025F6D6D4|nr:tRNA-guanine transglycosylase [Thermococcus sp.]